MGSPARRPRAWLAYLAGGVVVAFCYYLVPATGLVPQGWGTVIRAPLALLITTASSETQAAPIIADFQSKRIPVYGLLQRDGSVRVYTGAFESPDEAALFKTALKSTKNIDATLAYRVGRAY